MKANNYLGFTAGLCEILLNSLENKHVFRNGHFGVSKRNLLLTEVFYIEVLLFRHISKNGMLEILT